MFEGVLNMALLKNKAGVSAAKKLSTPLRELKICMICGLKYFNNIN